MFVDHITGLGEKMPFVIHAMTISSTASRRAKRVSTSIACSFRRFMPILVLGAIASCKKSDSPAADTAALVTMSDSAAADGPSRPIEGMPPAIVERIRLRDSVLFGATIQTIDSQAVGAARSVIVLSRRWQPGEVVTVAFNGGSPELRDSIARAATEWSKFANLRFNFWSDAGHQKYREWSPNDQRYQAHIRIGFDDRGFWSFVGRESIDKAVTKPSQASMNFEGFDEILPSYWEWVVLHEFGHAIALQHEHQNPLSTCETEFRWTDDPGYIPTVTSTGAFIPDAQRRRPGVYTVLGGPPNKWKKKDVDFNLRKLVFTTDIDAEPFDPQSIMKYYLESWMFRSGTGSTCYTQQALHLSSGDQAVAKRHYPADVAAAPSRDEEVRAELQALQLPVAARTHLLDQIRKMSAAQATTAASIPRFVPLHR